MPALARWSFAAASAAPSPRETTRPSRCRAALRRPAKTAAGGEGWTSASFPSSRPRPRHVARAYAPARPGSSDEECVEWDDTCAAGRTETPATPSSRGKPLLCFVNGKSGGRRGAALMELLANRDDIDAVEIVDLTAEGPNASLRRHVGVVPDLRVLVCGGDGTVAWVLQAIEELGETFPRPPIGILPLGTGNDLSRVFGWGSRYDDRLLDRLASALDDAKETRLDRWDVDVCRMRANAHETERTQETQDVGVTRLRVDGVTTRGNAFDADDETDETRERKTLKSKTSVTLHNYLGVGVDAKAALAFHEAREANPGLFFSSITNKLLYGVFGAVDFVTHSCRALLRDHVTIVADGETVEIPRGAEGIIVLNLNSYAGGARMWDAGEKGTHRKHFLSALLSGGVQDTRWCDPEDDDDSRLEESSKKTEKKLSKSFGKSKRDDGLLDVVAVYGAFHLGQLSLGTDRPVRLKQARDVRIDVSSDFPVHVDGQPWEETGGASIAISRRDCVAVLAADYSKKKSSMTSVGSGRGYEREEDELGSDDDEKSEETRGTFMGWEAWENPEYYDDLESAPHTCVRSMLD